MDAVGTYEQERYNNLPKLAELDSKIPFEDFVLATVYDLRNSAGAITSLARMLRDGNTRDNTEELRFIESIQGNAAKIVSSANSIIERDMRQKNDTSPEN